MGAGWVWAADLHRSWRISERSVLIGCEWILAVSDSRKRQFRWNALSASETPPRL
jgi:hypothetical protein